MNVFNLSIIRYNISTGEYDGWSGSVNSDIVKENVDVLGANNEGQLNMNSRQVSKLDVYSKFGFNETYARKVDRDLS